MTNDKAQMSLQRQMIELKVQMMRPSVAVRHDRAKAISVGGYWGLSRPDKSGLAMITTLVQAVLNFEI
jgi:hypothetical protein